MLKKTVITGSLLAIATSAALASSSENWNEFTNANNIYKEAYFNLLEIRLRHHAKLGAFQADLVKANDEYDKQNALKVQLEQDLATNKALKIETDSLIKTTLGKIVLQKVLVKNIAKENGWNQNSGDDSAKILNNSRNDIQNMDVLIADSVNKMATNKAATLAAQTQTEFVLLNQSRAEYNRTINGKQFLLNESQTRKAQIKNKLAKMPGLKTDLVKKQRVLSTNRRQLEKATAMVAESNKKLAELTANNGDSGEIQKLKHYLGIDRWLWLQISEIGSFNKYNAAVTEARNKVDVTNQEVNELQAQVNTEEALRADLEQVDMKIAKLSAELIEDKKQLSLLDRQASEYETLNITPLLAEKAQLEKQHENLVQQKSDKIAAQAKLIKNIKESDRLVQLEKSSIVKTNQLSTRIAQLEGQLVSQKNEYDKAQSVAEGLQRKILVMQADLENAQNGLEDARLKNDKRADILAGGAQ